MLEERPQGKPAGSAVPGPLGREVIWVLLDRGMLERWEVRPGCPEEPLILPGIHRRWVWGMRCSTLSATIENRTTGKKRRAQAQGEQRADLWSGLSVTRSGCCLRTAVSTSAASVQRGPSVLGVAEISRSLSITPSLAVSSMRTQSGSSCPPPFLKPRRTLAEV